MWEFELELRRAALLYSARPNWQRLIKQLRESLVVRVAGGRFAIWQNPFRVLRQQRVVHFTLKLRVCGNLSAEACGMCRVHLTPKRSRAREAL
jgi:uncharacterized protein (DUF2126 family)